MPAPPAELVKALRRGRVARHLFFELTHSSGVGRAWDGIGDFKLDGDLYTGVGGGHSIEGISDSGDIQNHTVSCKLNRVPITALFGADLDVRGDAAVIRIAWLNEDGTLIVPPRVVMRARGSHLLTDVDRNTSTVTLVMRGPLAEWSIAPRASYSGKDQRRRFADDSGFDLTKLLENTSIAGWSKDEEASGSVPIVSAPWTGHSSIADSLTGAIIGDDEYGAFIFTAAVSVGGSIRRLSNLSDLYREADTGVFPLVDFEGDGIVKVGGTACYIDINGVVRTPGGKLIIQGTNTARFLRRQTAIAGDGTPTVTTVTSQNVGPSPGRQLALTGGAVNASSSLGLVYCNKFGREVRHTSGTALRVSSSEAYVEADTGNPVTFTGGNVMQVGGSNCVVSSTGAILTASGKRVRLASNADAFLRVWT